jgi:CheY-like chemotaxis protein/signal transduction histidine kinase
VLGGYVFAALELGFLRRVRPELLELLERISELLAVTVRSARDRSRLEELLGRTQAQAEQLQSQQEELRVSNEELEEQSRALKESQVQMALQQTELEQTNAQLEEQTQILTRQKEQLSQSEALLEQRATELERASQYKSEFLANMSHELRTPLNSTLIFARLLADNKEGNLSPRQIEFAEAIHSAGNELLALINDILDLAKIESGKVEVVAEQVMVAEFVDSVLTGFRPLAQQKALALRMEVDPQVPAELTTDSHRVGQILRNLLANAFKFTAEGAVMLRVTAEPGERIAFRVQDTGIGISPEQQASIFEAFRQADGSIHRRYGGTGLGLTISRNLAAMLGGELSLISTVGVGSEFILTLPYVLRPAELPTPVPAPVLAQASATAAPALPPVAAVAAPAGLEVSEAFSAERQTLLIIEDDRRFAQILRDVAQEAGYQYVLAGSAGAGMEAALYYRPSAILLDVNLPDESGLTLLDRLKHNPATRHIPVHMMSVEDHAPVALRRGAVGYALKPVEREELLAALQRLEEKLAQNFRRVLVVEDDLRQLESIRHLLQVGEVEITGVTTAQAALEQLASTTFDCMVMDLNLPDMSGYDLMEQMAEQERFSFPPVIVYTGRSLTREEEQRLGRFSKSIIIKDARSPERLLDEVTLFLHQVETTLPPDRQRMLKQVRLRESAFEGRRILVVEDDARNIFALTSLIEPRGAVVEIARNGVEALQRLERAEPFDLVLMDVMMPEMDGITAMQEIRKRPEWKNLPIIALTAKAMKSDQEKCLAAGANDYLAKPLDVDRLLSLMRIWLSR